MARFFEATRLRRMHERNMDVRLAHMISVLGGKIDPAKIKLERLLEADTPSIPKAPEDLEASMRFWFEAMNAATNK